MSEIHLHYLNHADIQALAMTDAEIVAAVEHGLLAQGRGETTIEPRVHLVPEKDYPGHFSVLRGYIRPRSLRSESRCRRSSSGWCSGRSSSATCAMR